MEKLYPLTFTPEFRDYIWGGRNLETLFGRALPEGIIAESWDISGHPSASTRVDAGFWRGSTLPEVMQELGLDLVGTRSGAMLARAKFPLLVKLLDANLPLSVQVHPDDAYAAAHEGGELGKTEMWYVLHAKEGAELVLGLAAGVSRESFSQALSLNRLEDQLHRVPIKRGDCIYVPSGTVHALLAGAVVAEIQQNSDTTYRVYDWGRMGADGKPRPLHVAQALDVINWDMVEPGPARPMVLESAPGMCREQLVHSDKFVVERIRLGSNARFSGTCDGGSFEIWGCVEGAGEIEGGGICVAADAVRFALLPAAIGDYSVTADTDSVWLRAYVPE